MAPKKTEYNKLVGQMLMIGFQGKEVDDNLRRMIIDEGIGGVILFRRNIESPSQLANLCGLLKEAGRERNPNLPLLIAIDQEGGRVFRLPPPFRQYSSYRDLASQGNNKKAVRESVLMMGEELRGVGINMDMAPVLDIDINSDNPIIGDRSFGPNPNLVAELGQIVIDSLGEKGIIAVGKHFPGHGNTAEDSHLTLPVDNRGREEMAQNDLLPFKKTINAGLAAIMTAHVIYPQVDPQYPATISKIILNEILREELGFKGVIITDDLEMKGISEGWTIGETVELGIGAGVDIFLSCHILENQLAALDKVRDLYGKGDKWSAKIENAIDRVISLKGKMADLS
ncbi:MAG: beta-N-acetylhexosaminidase [Nitrospinota bacterium]